MGFIDCSRNRSGMSGFAVVWCPDFKLQAVVRRVQTKPEPVALVDDTKRQSVILSRNEAAIRQGVEVGMKTVQGLARCPGLRVESPSAPAEEAAARTLLETSFGWVPGIEETGEGWLTLDLSTQSPGEWVDSAQRLRGRLYEAGVEVVIGIGETPSLARIAALAARAEGKSFRHLDPDRRMEHLDQLSLGLAETAEELQERLRLWGVSTLGAFARLSREAIAARLGDEGIELWLRLTGRLQRPLRLAKLDELFEEHQDFDYEVREREPLLFVVNRFLDQLIVRVGATGRAAVAVHVLLTFSDGSCRAKRLPLPEPVLDHEILFHLISGYLDGLEMKAAIGGIRIRFEPSDPVASQRTLFGAGLKNRYQFEDTMKRLRKIVGSERVGTPRPLSTHRPGVFELQPLPDSLEECEERKGPPVTGATVRRFRGGLRVAVQMREGRPFRIESRPVSGLVVDLAGPWYCGGDWWHAGRDWNRVEWDVEIRARGVFRLVREKEQWNLEGRYE